MGNKTEHARYEVITAWCWNPSLLGRYVMWSE